MNAGRNKEINQDFSQAYTARWRYVLVSVLFGVMFLALISQAVYLQVVDNEYLQSQGDARYLRVKNEQPTRGMILDRHGKPLAVSTPVDSIWAHPPTIIKNQSKYSYSKLSKLLGLSRQQFLQLVTKNKGRQFMYLKRHLSPKQAQEIIALEIPGINSLREYRRYYPAGPVVGHVLGFTNIDNVGQEGAELAFNSILSGHAGKTQVLKDQVGHVVEYVEQLSPVEHGNSITLSLDARIQYLAYRYLQAAVKKNQASSASLVVLDAKTGEILAMVNAPDFNPNNRAELKSSHFRNRAITDLFEPGSVVKPFTIAMAIDQGEVNPDTLVDTSPGYMMIGSNKISDTKNYGELTVAGVIVKSSNIGSAKIAMQLAPRHLVRTFDKLGFGHATDIGLQGEQKGLVPKRRKLRTVEHATLSYGYGLSVNTLQLARAYTALANDGKVLPVSLYPVRQRPEGEKVFSSETVIQLKDMLKSVVSLEGTAKKAKVEQYSVAGKTGTAHRLVNGRYDDDSYTSVFAGFAPADDPELVMVVVVNDPQGDDYYGGLVAAPVFSNVMTGALRFRNVLPDDVTTSSDSENLAVVTTNNRRAM